MLGGSFNFGPSAGPRSSVTRGRIQGGVSHGVNYPSPFFDIAHTYLPATVKQLFRWCRYYFLTNPLINATVCKMSEYPITDIVIDSPDEEVKRKWMEFFQEQLRFRSMQIECGLDYYAYGNSMNSLGMPFRKWLRCASCGFSERADKIRHMWVFTNYAFRLSCPKCGYLGEAIPKDLYLRNAGDINIIRWNCEHVEVDYNDVTGKTKYFYTIPPTVRNDAMIGKKEAVEALPQIFIQAMREQKGVVFNEANFFHMKRATLAQQDRGWGTPLILPVLKDTFYLQLMKKAQEAILTEHIVPLRVLFPQAGSGSSDPYTTINLAEWREQVAMEIARWRLDPNYIPILPLPIGNQTIGGDGRALLLTQEIQAWSEHIIMGMGVPKEFLLGGMSYSGSNVSMRMLENQFLGHIQRQRQFANWIVKTVAAYMGWPEVKVHFKPFKMADDIQRKAFMFQMNQAGLVSSNTLLSDSDLNQVEERDLLINENSRNMEVQRQKQVAMAGMQAEVQVIMAKAQANAQQTLLAAQQGPVAPGEPGDGSAGASQGLMQGMQSDLGMGQDMANAQPQQGKPQAGMDMLGMAEQLAQQLVQLPPDQQQLALDNLRMQSPELAELVEQYASQMGAQQAPATQGGALGQSVSQVNMRPLPEQRAPRRLAASV
jgi:hypothetical protein